MRSHARPHTQEALAHEKCYSAGWADKVAVLHAQIEQDDALRTAVRAELEVLFMRHVTTHMCDVTNLHV